MNGNFVKISIVIPIYNVEQYLPCCLLSCVNQTLHDIEIIGVNDGSTDSSLDVLREFASRDYRIRIIDKANGGLSSARNAGIQVASGKIVMFLDSDDFLSTNACERVWRETLEGQTDVVIFGTDIFPTNPAPTSWHYRVLHVKTRRYDEPDIFNAVFHEPGIKPFVWRQAYTRKFFDENHVLFDETVRYGEDIVFQMEAIPYAQTIAVISDQLYHYRWYREGSLMQTFQMDIDDKICQHVLLADIIANHWRRKGWLEDHSKEFTQWVLDFLVYDIGTKVVQHKSEHYESVSNLLKRYGLYDDLCRVSLDHKYLARRITRKH